MSAGWGAAFVRVAVFLILACGMHLAGARAATIEKLLMPGPVVKSHAKVESDCASCHANFQRGTQDKLCFSCHKPIAADRAEKTGFHGKSRLMAGVACSACHTDHIGREANIVPLGKETFNHVETDFQLNGAHRNAECADCHASGKKWAEAPHDCFSCHQKDEPHKGNLGKDCASCHNETSWRQVAAFDHGKTKFPLKGAHAKQTCMSCHMGEVYKGLPAACNDCHAIQDIHAGRFGPKCASCHTEEKWKAARFDHDKTEFPLKGAHQKAACENCHVETASVPVPKACFGCHEKQDVHKGKLGVACQNCHSEVAWRANVRFDHGLTNYPLVGLHVPVACEACHADKSYKGAPSTCFACHKADDVHEGRLATNCGSCHSANGWSRVGFDHGRDTTFALTGAHAKTGCYGCHTQTNVASAKLPTDCYSCHAKEDVHRGAFGRDCAKCHSTATFANAFIRH
jgi:Cytochrome c7 and related cytochrome c/Cytochrome c3